MTILVFPGDCVAAQYSVGDSFDGFTDFEIRQTPFNSRDTVKIRLREASVCASGYIEPVDAVFSEISVERDGIEYEFGVSHGSEILGSEENAPATQGATFFMTRHPVAPPTHGPFADLEAQTYLFSSEQSFSWGPEDYTLVSENPCAIDGFFNRFDTASLGAPKDDLCTANSSDDSGLSRSGWAIASAFWGRKD